MTTTSKRQRIQDLPTATYRGKRWHISVTWTEDDGTEMIQLRKRSFDNRTWIDCSARRDEVKPI
jgi:hypothetical protein